MPNWGSPMVSFQFAIPIQAAGLLGILLGSAPATGCTAIKTILDIQNIQKNLSGSYCLDNDIDAKGAEISPIGTSNQAFSGTFDGQGHTINGLTISAAVDSALSDLGLFRENQGVIRNISLANLLLIAKNSGTYSLYQEPDIGGLAGVNFGTIENSGTDGAIVGPTDPVDYFVGGLVGYNFGDIRQSHSFASVVGLVSPPSPPSPVSVGIGGLAGGNQKSIAASFASAHVLGQTLGQTQSEYRLVSGTGVGGLVGQNQVGGKIANSYSTSLVDSLDSVASAAAITVINSEGGLVANNYATVSSSFAAGPVLSTGNILEIGGMNGVQGPGISTNSYWDTETTGQSASTEGGIGLPSSSFKSSTLLTGFAPNIWSAGASNPYINNGYPYLSWQTIPPFDVQDATITNNGHVYIFAPIGQLDPKQYSVGALIDAFDTVKNSWQALFTEFAKDRAALSDPYRLAGQACLSTVYAMLGRAAAETMTGNIVASNATVDLFQEQGALNTNACPSAGCACWPTDAACRSATTAATLATADYNQLLSALRLMTFTIKQESSPGSFSPLTQNVGFASLLETGPVIVHGPMFGDPSGHYMLVTGMMNGPSGAYIVANEPLLGIQVRLPYANGVVSPISDAYDARDGMWTPLTDDNITTISGMSHVEPERFNSNFNELCGCVRPRIAGSYPYTPRSYQTVNLK